MKVIGNISINIPGHKGKKSCDGDKLIETIRAGKRCKEKQEILDGARGLVVGYEYKEWENIGCFETQ